MHYLDTPVADPVGPNEEIAGWLDRFTEVGVLPEGRLAEFRAQFEDRLTEITTVEDCAALMARAGLLTAYQAERASRGEFRGLRLGSYRVLDELGGGSQGRVYHAEHAHLGGEAAVKVLPFDSRTPANVLDRFRSEMRTLAGIQHPHVVSVIDAGVIDADLDGPAMHYLAMEYVRGGNLDQYLRKRNSPLPVAQACEWIRQAASGLQAAHDQHLIHRDIRPSNLLLTQHGQVKLVNFGIAGQSGSNHTRPGGRDGGLDFMAPEQALDPGKAGSAVDIYALGATLFWLLTGQPPYEPTDDPERVTARYEQEARIVRDLRPDIPEDLGHFLSRMLSREPDRRPALPITVMIGLSRFAAPASGTWDSSTFGRSTGDFSAEGKPRSPGSDPSARSWRVLIAERDQQNLDTAVECLEMLGCVCVGVRGGLDALQALQTETFDLLIVRRQLPPPDGFVLCRFVRERPSMGNMKIILLAGDDLPETQAEAFAEGADGVMLPPFDPLVLAAKAQHLLRLKESQDRVAKLTDHLLASNRQLEESLLARADDVRKAQDALLYAMAKMAESREGETPGHLMRMQQYSRCLAEKIREDGEWPGVIDGKFLDFLNRCVPLHDIGKIALPDELLHKPGSLTAEERKTIQTHAVIGSEMLEAIGREYGDSMAFLGVARSIVRHHHERHDGQGYPDGLSGEQIPYAARLVALADVYDALRRERAHKEAMDHPSAVEAITVGSPGQFDPVVLKAFQRQAGRFEQIYESIPN